MLSKDKNPVLKSIILIPNFDQNIYLIDEH